MNFGDVKGNALAALVKGITATINVKWKIIILKPSWTCTE